MKNMEKRPEMNNCPKCGRKVHEDYNFCKYCGAQLERNGISEETTLSSPSEEIKNVIIKRFEGIKNHDEKVITSIIDVRRYSKFDDWPPYGRQDADTALKNEVGAYKVLANYNYDFTNIKLDVMNNVAITTLHLHYSGEIRKRSFEVYSRVTTILVKQDSEWKIIHEHYSRWPQEQRRGWL